MALVSRTDRSEEKHKCPVISRVNALERILPKPGLYDLFSFENQALSGLVGPRVKAAIKVKGQTAGQTAGYVTIAPTLTQDSPGHKGDGRYGSRLTMLLLALVQYQNGHHRLSTTP